MSMPRRGIPTTELFQRMESFRAKDMSWREGRTFGYVYDAGREAEEICQRAYTMFMTENALDPTVYPSLLRFENEIIGMVAAHLSADDDVVGSFTSGGTESILLAVKTARDYFRAHKPEIRRPEMILPVTAHAAHHKAAHYLGVEVVPVPVDEHTYKADPAAVEQAITDRTILLVGSAPSYAHGVVDPITDLGRLARDRGLLLHVDACIGGFLLPYFRRLGAPVPDFDFRVPGVTSLSVDLHKYGYTAKGASVVLYRDKELRRHQIFTCAEWTGYSVVNPTVQSTKSGGPLAAAWALLHHLGDEGYLRLAEELLSATGAVIAGIGKIDGLRVMGQPEMCLVAFTSDQASVFHIADEMKARGWYIQPQLAFRGSRENLHLSIGPSNVRWIDKLLADLRDSVAAAAKLESGQLAAAVKATFQHLKPEDISPEVFSQLLAMGGLSDVQVPERMAEINEVLNELPVAIRERLLSEFINQLFRPARVPPEPAAS